MMRLIAFLLDRQPDVTTIVGSPALLSACPGLRLDPDTQPSFYYGARGFVQHGTDALPVLT